MILTNPFTLFALVIISLVQGKLESPCPDVFRYDLETAVLWWGVITLNVPEELEGLWVKIILDTSVKSLTNFEDEIVSKDNIQFTIKRPSVTLEPGIPLNISFIVNFPESKNIVPLVRKIKLNGRQICPIDKTSLTKPRLPPNANINCEDKNGKGNQFFKGDFSVGLAEKSTSNPVIVVKKPIQCGTVAQSPSPFISHGLTTIPGQWPWHIALYHLQGVDLIYSCGGTLISERFVVTAAHCVTVPRTKSHVDKQFLVIYLGKYSLIDLSNDIQTKKVDRIIVHPEYNPSVFYNDIALLKLNSEADFNNFVRPCCLWEDENDNIEIREGLQGTVVGWGYDENKQLSHNLMQTKMPIVSTRMCLLSNRDFFSQLIYENNFCAGFRNGTSVCNGDSGGGLVIQKFSAKGLNTLWQLRGIVSVGVALQGEKLCDPNQYVLFTDAGQYVKWIKQIIQQP